MLFISSSVRDDMAAIISSLASAQGVLTVSDARLFVQAGGIIGLVNVDGEIRFEINSRAALQAHVQISSPLLNLF